MYSEVSFHNGKYIVIIDREQYLRLWNTETNKHIWLGTLTDFLTIFQKGLSQTHKIVCAWCDKTLLYGTEPISHGICPDCAEKEKAKAASCDR